MTLKQDGMNFVLCPKQGGRFSTFFCPKQGQGLSMAHLYPNIGWDPRAPGPLVSLANRL